MEENSGKNKKTVIDRLNTKLIIVPEGTRVRRCKILLFFVFFYLFLIYK